ncbi:hypothetical protein SAMN06269173_107117 [Hymenobacter mucosus]|uniref:Uncharacterized protein n=1 Tax=Hymenobacter mucosus TaxID=1411120 RepID=A0A238ZEG0_9BACT|nr:hypothetical protein SAMN06269173_107117 [Hymenobacter mucosus]
MRGRIHRATPLGPFLLQEGNRKLLAISVGSLTLSVSTSLVRWKYDAAMQGEIARGFALLRRLPANIYLSSHAQTFSK